jgi:hypothetical protein
MKNRMSLSNYDITWDFKELHDIYFIDDEVISKVMELEHKIIKPNDKLITDILSLIKKYPKTPHFKNILAKVYIDLGHEEKGLKQLKELLKENPDFVFAKTELMSYYLQKNKLNEIAILLGESLEIEDLYKNRKIFHISEFMTFYHAVMLYCDFIGNFDKSEKVFELMKKVNKKFNFYDEEVLKEIKIIHEFQKKAKENYDLRMINTNNLIDIKNVIPNNIKNNMPKFSHKIIKKLYCNSLRIDRTILIEILALPRETLLEDLEKVIQDSIDRFDFFYHETTWHPTTHEFPMHAINLLAELKAFECRDSILKIIRQDWNYLEYWFGDYITGDFFEVLYIFSENGLDEYRDFLFEPDLDDLLRSLIPTTISYILYFEPERRKEILNWFEDLLNEYIKIKEDKSIVDPDLIGFIIQDLININAVEFKPLIKKLYKNKMVSTDICGDYKDVINEFEKFDLGIGWIFKKHNDIFERYEYYISIFGNYEENIDLLSLEDWEFLKFAESILDEDDFDDDDDFDEDDDDFDEDDDDFDEDEDEDDYDFFNDFNPEKPNIFNQQNNKDEFNNILKFKPKTFSDMNIGRNDPCPCGSGKKYKKCCMNSKIN